VKKKHVLEGKKRKKRTAFQPVFDVVRAEKEAGNAAERRA